MTPISFALEILLDCTAIEQAHKKCRKYIKELEAQGVMISTVTSPRRSTAQAPSTQRLLDAAPSIPPPMPAAILGGEINNGDGTRGKRKW